MEKEAKEYRMIFDLILEEASKKKRRARKRKQHDASKPFLGFSLPSLTSITERITTFLSPISNADEINNNQISATPVIKSIDTSPTVNQDEEITPTPIFKKPLLNRDTNTLRLRSSRVVGPIDRITLGRVGLRNIDKTCYMNTVIQCLRTLPSIRDFFCSGIYAEHVTKENPTIISQTACLVRILWSSAVEYIDPIKFYDKVKSVAGIYGRGHHQDCMEFFLFLLHHLSEDCSYGIDRPPISFCKEMAWFDQFQGKTSFFIQQFYHQIKIQQLCNNCQTVTFRFEMESTFMLPVPPHDFHVETLMEEYMADYVIPEYCCSTCRQPVLNRKSVCYEPRIVVLTLKRYSQIVKNGSVTIKKIDSKAQFQVTGFQLGNGRYNLNAVAMHIGSINSGHYTAACLTQNGWFHFNDEHVVPIDITDNQVKQQSVAFFYTLCD